MSVENEGSQNQIFDMDESKSTFNKNRKFRSQRRRKKTFNKRKTVTSPSESQMSLEAEITTQQLDKVEVGHSCLTWLGSMFSVMVVESPSKVHFRK